MTVKSDGGNNMLIRKYKSSDYNELEELFYRTVHTVNAKDYSKKQLDAWTKNADTERWDRSFSEHLTAVAVEDKEIVGFGSIDKNGCLDMLYVHSDFQRQGIGSAICNILEYGVTANVITVQASITAKPFFEKIGYTALKEQQVIRGGTPLTNYVMEKYTDSDMSSVI